MKDNYRPRLSIVLTEEQHKALQKLIPWGVQKQLFSIIVDDVIRLMEKHGQVFIAAALNKAIKLEEYSSIRMEEEDGND